jgi:hypothetical protein
MNRDQNTGVLNVVLLELERLWAHLTLILLKNVVMRRHGNLLVLHTATNARAQQDTLPAAVVSEQGRKGHGVLCHNNKKTPFNL